MRESYHRWSEAELQYIRDNYSFLSDHDMSLQLTLKSGHPITSAMVRRQRRKLQIGKTRGRKRKNNSIV
jgi:hypothetical protein